MMIDVRDCTVRSMESTLLPPVSFSVPRGSSLVVRGSNGTGKSTLLACLSGTVHPTSGQVLIDGIVASASDTRFRTLVSPCLAVPPTAWELTVRDHLHLVATSWLVSADRAAESVIAVCEELEMDHLMDQFPGELSAGQSQLFAIAVSLVRPARVFVLDEPENRLDRHRVGIISSVLEARITCGATVVVATHDEHLAARLHSKVLDLDRAPYDD